MSQSDLGGGPDPALEVKPNFPDAGSGGGASTTSESGAPTVPDPAGNLADSGEADPKARRPDKNLMRETVKRAEKAEANFEKVLDLLLGGGDPDNGRQAAPPVEDKAPFSTSDITNLSNEGKAEEVAAALQANMDWQAKKIRADLLAEVHQGRAADTFDRFAVDELGLTDTDSEWGMAVAARAAELQKKFPQVLNTPIAARLAAQAQIGPRETYEAYEQLDLRGESLANSGPTAPPSPTSSAPAPLRIDPNAPNRGLPAEVVQRLSFHPRLEVLLKRSPDPREEHKRLTSLNRILERQADVQGYRKQTRGR
jgi:hypothetical protein